MKVTRRTLFGLAVVTAAMESSAALRGEGASATAGSSKPIARPRRLKAGDTVGLIDPASATWDPIDIDIVEESLAALELRSKRGQHLLARRGYFAGGDEDRAADLMAMFRDPDISAILPVRGGWGCARLLPHLEYDVIAANPKIIVGYSDLTALLLAIHARTGLVTFHGPNGASSWNPLTVDFFTRVLMRGEAVAFENPRERGDTLAQERERIKPIATGRAAGRLLGGNLSVLCGLLGTPFLPAWRDAILFVEDINEAPYRIDRMLTQLALAGVLGAARGFVFGHCTDCDPDGGFGSLTIPDILDDHVGPLKIPSWRGALIGHIDRQFTLPLGTSVEIDAGTGTIRMLEPAVV